MKKLLIALLSVLLVFTVAACGATTSEESGKTDTNDIISSTSEISIEQQVVYEGNDIKVTANKLDFSDTMETGVEVTVENNSESQIIFQTRRESINNVDIEAYIHLVIEPGESQTDVIYFSNTKLDTANISMIKNIEFSVAILNPSTYEEVFVSDTIEIATNADDTYEQTYFEGGRVLYEQNNIKIVLCSEELDTTEGYIIPLYIENKTDSQISVEVFDYSINGQEGSGEKVAEVTAGHVHYPELTITSFFLEMNKIDTIKTVEFKFVINDTLTSNKIAESDLITIQY